MAWILPASGGAGLLKYCLMHQASQPTLRDCTTQQTIARPSTVCALAGSHCQSPGLPILTQDLGSSDFPHCGDEGCALRQRATIENSPWLPLDFAAK